jgi:hypothetical protein
MKAGARFTESTLVAVRRRPWCRSGAKQRGTTIQRMAALTTRASSHRTTTAAAQRPLAALSLDTQRLCRAASCLPVCLITRVDVSRSGSTQYYFFYGGVRHYHGVRFWERCDGHCEQTVSVDQASFRVDYAYYNYRTTSDSELSAAATSALVAVWPMIKPELVTVIPSNVGGMHVAYTVFLPDGTNKDAFEETVRSCVERACSGETTCALVQPPGATELTTGEAKCPQTIEVAYTTVSAVAMPAAGTRKMEMEEEFEGGLRWWVWVVIVLCCMCCAVVVGGEKSGGGASGGTNHYDTYALGQ